MNDGTSAGACPRCGNSDSPRANGGIKGYCRPCWNGVRRERRAENLRLNPVPCVECGRPLPNRAGQRITCSAECSTLRKRRVAGVDVDLLPRPCAHCKKDFIPTRAGHRYCSRSCGDAAKYLLLRESPGRFAKRRERDAEYRSANRERLREVNARWRAENRDYHREICRAWYAANVERARASSQAWARQNAPTRAEKERRRRAAKMRTAVHAITPVMLTAKAAYWGDKCWMCGGPPETWDHVKPLAAGGPHILANLRPACRPCNSSKSARWPYPLAV